MQTTALFVIGNGVFLGVSLLLAIFLLRQGALYTYHYGKMDKMEKIKWKILKNLVLLFFLSLTGIVFNLTISFL